MPFKFPYGDRLDIASAGDRQLVSNPATKASTPPIEPDRHCRNGQHPNAMLMNSLNEATNQAVLYRSREVFRSPGSFSVILSSGVGDRARWMFSFKTSSFTHAIRAVVFLTAQNTSGAAYNSYGRLDIYSDAAMTSLVTSETFTYGTHPVGGAVEVVGWEHLRCVEKMIGLSPSTTYYACFTDVDYGRLQSACVYEMCSMSENADGFLAQNITARSAILGVHRQNVAEISADVWKNGGSRVLWWGTDDGTAPVARALSTPVNIIDETSTSNTAASPGYTLDLTGKARISQTAGVPVVMAVCAKLSAVNLVTDAGVNLVDSGGSVVMSVTWIGAGSATTSPAWYTATGVLPAGVDKYDLQLFSNDIATLSVYAVSIWEQD